MKTIRHTATLFYYDGPQVFEARDTIGGHYVAVAVESETTQDRYLVAGVSPERLRQFRSGALDLRSLLAEESEADWFLATVEAGLDQPLKLEPQTTTLAASDLLPEPDFFLHSHPAESEALKEARLRNNLVLEVAVDPPEAADDHRIRVETLVGLLGHVQTMVRYAYGAALRELTPGARRRLDRTDAHLLDVVIPAAVGSFRVVLEAVKAPDMFGQNELGRAMERVDVLFADANNPQRALATIKAHRGHLAGAYLRLLRFLVHHKTGLRYSWAEPAFSRPNSGAITEGDAGPLVDMLSGVSNLGAEPIVLTGDLDKADKGRNTWRLITPDGTVSGRVKEGGPTLGGLKIGSAYRFSCLEEIEEVEGTGREQRTFYLTEYERA
ncbi:MAG: DUF6575 domain-containing protein [Blastocatellia bacterium]